jgi:hypothetical protein
MALRKSTNVFCKQEPSHNKEKQNGSEEELYFEMEYPDSESLPRSGTTESDTISFSSKSVESFGSQYTIDSQDSPYREGRRESSVGPILERPTSLRISSSFKRNISSGSLPRTNQQKIPKFSFQNFSVPTTPADSWEREKNFLRKVDITSSTSSVEEATESILKKTRSRLSLNLGVFDGSLSPGSPTRSPRFIPKFLRSSFSKLMIKDKPTTPETSNEPRSLPFFGKMSSSALNSPRLEDPQNYDRKYSTDEDEVSPPSTPTTKLFVEESLAAGLPIIPFNYPTFVIVEKKRTENKTAKPDEKKQNVKDVATGENKKYSHSAPSSRKVSSINHREQSATNFHLEEKSLEKLLGRAKQEMEEEASVKKRSWIRGYAANNSRALLRRRSSVSEYVEMSLGAVAKDGSNPNQSYAILENSTRKESLNYYSFDRGKPGKLKFNNCRKNVINSTTMHSRGVTEEKEGVDGCDKVEDYLDMTCGGK